MNVEGEGEKRALVLWDWIKQKNLLEKEEGGKHFSLGITDRFVNRNPFTP